nr:hypothetical protein [Nocardia abscessus]
MVRRTAARIDAGDDQNVAADANAAKVLAADLAFDSADHVMRILGAAPSAADDRSRWPCAGRREEGGDPSGGDDRPSARRRDAVARLCSDGWPIRIRIGEPPRWPPACMTLSSQNLTDYRIINDDILSTAMRGRPTGDRPGMQGRQEET